MKLVIDIPDEEYKRWRIEGEMDALVVRSALVNSIPIARNNMPIVDAFYQKGYLDAQQHIKDLLEGL